MLDNNREQLENLPVDNGEPETAPALADKTAVDTADDITDAADEKSAQPDDNESAAVAAVKPTPAPAKGGRALEFIKSVLGKLGLLLTGALIALLLVPNALSMYISSDNGFAKLSALQAIIRKYYVHADELDENALNDMMATGYLYGLGDPYSAYIDKDTYSAITYSNEGGTSGVGVIITLDNESGYIYVIHVSDQSPSAEAGIQRGDRITAVGDMQVTADNYSQATEKIRGEAGSKVTLTILRDGKTFEVDVTRADFIGNSVYRRMIGDICYIEITDFNSATTSQFADALAFADENGAKGLIFDLRDNTGGLVDVTSEMLDMLLPKGEIGYAVYNGGKRVSLATSDKDEVDLPMAVLTNGGTASASEYFALALRDAGKAALIGEKTFGKGIMQSTFPLGDGSAVRVTVAKFYTSSGSEFHGVGITPDQEVSIPEATNRFLLSDENEPLIQAAIKQIKEKTATSK